MCIIDEAQEKDLQFISELEKELFLEEAWSYSQILEEFKNEFSKIWVSKENERVIGYLIFRKIYNSIEIFKIGIKKEYQRKGIGTLFVERLIEFAKEKKVDKIFLEVKISNLSAFSFYKKLGFKEIYRRKKYYGDEDGLVMLKELESY